MAIFHVLPIYGLRYHYYGFFIFIYGLVYGFLRKTVKYRFLNECNKTTSHFDRTVTVTVTVNRNRKTVTVTRGMLQTSVVIQFF